MKITLFGGSVVGALFLSLSVCSSAAQPSSQDTMFAVAAAQAGMTEVKLATLAMQKTTNPNVSSFAREMKADHGKANAQLASIVTSEGRTLPSNVSAKNAALMSKLSAASGSSFDTMYLTSQLPAHRKVLALFKKEVANGSDSALVNFAKATIPVVESHIAMDRTDISKVASGGMSMPAMK